MPKRSIDPITGEPGLTHREKLLIDAFIAQNRPRPASLAAPGSLYSHSAGGFDSTAADPG
jgi:hypothetical protein